MKNNHSFSLVAVVILAGVIVAFASPAPTAPTITPPSTEAAPAVHATN